MAWIFLIIAGIFEWGWPVGLKLGWTDKGVSYGWLAFSVISIIASSVFLLLAQRTIPMGTAYAVWTGIGAVGTFLIGLIVFQEPATAVRFVCVGLIAAGIIGLKFAGSPASE